VWWGFQPGKSKPDKSPCGYMGHAYIQRGRTGRLYHAYVLSGDGSWTYTTTGGYINPLTKAQCAGDGTYSTSGSSVAMVYNHDTCAASVPYTVTDTYSIYGNTLTMTLSNGVVTTWAARWP
jgi:hypothetical protein